MPPGVQVGGTTRVDTQGTLATTGNALDLAVEGAGYFQVQMPDGTTGYTRDGSFQVSAQGQLVTNNGYLLQPGITIPATAQSVTIGNDGTVSVTLNGSGSGITVGGTAGNSIAVTGTAASASLMAACASAPPNLNDNLIVPGRRIGVIELGLPLSLLLTAEGQPVRTAPIPNTTATTYTFADGLTVGADEKVYWIITEDQRFRTETGVAVGVEPTTWSSLKRGATSGQE